MTAANIFKMEMYKNFRDQTWMIITGVLSLMTLILSISIISIIEQFRDYSYTYAGNGFSESMAIITYFLFQITMWAIMIYFTIFPFHLLSRDYRNNVLGLMVASGVKRENYFLIKLLSSLLTILAASAAIFLLPLILFLGVYNSLFIEVMVEIFDVFSNSTAFIYIFASLIAQLYSVALLFLVVIMTRGKIWGIFIYYGINSFLSVIWFIFFVFFLQSIAYSSTASEELLRANLFGVFTIFAALLALAVSVLIGYFHIKKQDL